MERELAICRSIEEVRQWRNRQEGSVGFFPTMGALHDGHEQSMKRLRSVCDHLVLSVFVNPIQFGPNEDYANYPRTYEKNLEVAKRVGVDMVFLPTPEMMYPKNYSTYVEEFRASQPLCGIVRPRHFRGVTTVVMKLFNIVKPHRAYFGLKDAQQFFVLRKMVNDLNVDIKVRGVPTVREEDGLAMSSRNEYLSADLRERAPILYQTLREAVAQLESGGQIDSVTSEAKRKLRDQGFDVQYFDCLSLPDLNEEISLQLRKEAPYVLAAAAVLEGVRLIDNVMIQSEILRTVSGFEDAIVE